MSTFKSQAGINSYKVKEVNINHDGVIGQYLDAQSMFHIYPKLQGTEKMYEILDKADMARPDILGQKSEFFDLLKGFNRE